MHQSGKAKRALKDVAFANPDTSIEAIRPCPTRWTVRVAALQTVMKQLGCILEAMDEIYDDRGDIAAKAKGLYTTFSDGTSVLAVIMALSVFKPLEELCIALQSTNETVSSMMSAVNKVIYFLENCRSEGSFAALFTNATNVITKLELNEIRVPRERKVPRHKDSGRKAYRASSVENHFRKEYFKVIGMALQQLRDRFHQPGIIKYMKMEDCLLKSNEALDELLK